MNERTDLKKPLQDAIRGIMGPKKAVERPEGWVYSDTPEGNAIAESRLRQFDMLENHARALQDKATDPKRKERLGVRVERICRLRACLCADMASAKAGEACSARVSLSAVPYNPPRALGPFEMRVDFMSLNDHFNRAQARLEERMRKASGEESKRNARRIAALLAAGGIADALAVSFGLRGEVRDAVAEAIREAYGTGKAIAASTLGIATPATPSVAAQLMRAEAADTAEQYAAALEATARSVVRAGVASGANPDAVAARLATDIDALIEKAVANISGTVVGQYVNRGGMDTYMQNVNVIASFQRSEVLDEATCPICEAMDGLVIDADDPFRSMEIVHTHCRGLWVPVFKTDEDPPETTGIPARIRGRFETVDGRPMVNAFKQLKRTTPAGHMGT